MDAYADETAIEADGVIDEVLQLLTSTDPEDRIEAAGVLCEWVNSAYGDVGSALGAAMRQKGGVPVLAKLWSDHELLDALVPRRLVASAARGRDDAERADANLQANRRALALLHEVQA